MITQITWLQLKNAVDKVLHVPGNYQGGILEMALVLDYHIERNELQADVQELTTRLKKHSEIFRNVRLNLIHWLGSEQIENEVVPLPFLQMGNGIKDLSKNGQTMQEICGDGKSINRLLRDLKLYQARSKLIIMLTDGAWTINDWEGAKRSLQPFLNHKLIIMENGKAWTGYPLIQELQRRTGD